MKKFVAALFITLLGFILPFYTANAELAEDRKNLSIESQVKLELNDSRRYVTRQHYQISVVADVENTSKYHITNSYFYIPFNSYSISEKDNQTKWDNNEKAFLYTTNFAGQKLTISDTQVNGVEKEIEYVTRDALYLSKGNVTYSPTDTVLRFETGPLKPGEKYQAKFNININSSDSNRAITSFYTSYFLRGDYQRGYVTWKYVDENGNTLRDQKRDVGYVGRSTYKSTPEDIPGYSLVDIQGNATGTVTAEEQTITFVYRKNSVIGGDVTAIYLDESGDEISSKVVLTGNAGESYTTEQKTIEGYTFKEVQGNPSGTFTESEQTITYIYAKDHVAGGDVTASYVDESGNEISSKVILTGNVGESYTTEQKTIGGYTFKEVQGSPSGTFTESDQTVIYIYTKDPVSGGEVAASYVDESGNEISSKVILTGSVGESYTTEQKIIEGYTFKEVQGNTSGTFTESEQTVTYVYSKVPVAGGAVMSRYIDENGEVIADNSFYTGNIGENYTTEKKIITGYTFKEVQGNPTGAFTEEEQTVTYVYTKNPVAGGTVTARYVDGSGNPITENAVFIGNVGEIAGYTYKEVQGKSTGTFTEEEQTVTYVYTKNPVAGGTVTARYVDESGNPIIENVVFTGNVGENYATEQKIIADYTYKEVQGNPTGTFTESEQTITYVYTKIPTVGSTVTAKYVDENGNSILDSMIYTGNVGESYTTEQISIDGYTFVELYGNPTGTFTEEEQTITYVYKKNKKETSNTIVPSDNEQLPKKNEISYQKTLPKAGEKENRVFTIVGVLLSSSLILFSFYKKKQTKKSI
ncbi:MAG: MucBP domain-containing protein [Enterococcus faecalis]|nr:MucBP domain-containing protein [Enterococcus faecalis]